MGDWDPDEKTTLSSEQGCMLPGAPRSSGSVPARVAGTQQVAAGARLTLKQEFQKLSGSLSTEGKTYALEGGKVRGEDVSFKAGGKEYHGRVNGKSLELR